MALWTQGIERVCGRKVDEHEAELIDNEIFDYYGLHKKPTGGPIGDLVTRPEVEKLMEDSI